RETWALCYPTVESLSNPDSVAMVAYEDDWPAAGGMYYRSGDVIEVLHVGTHSSFRRRGYGRAVTTALTIHGFEQGARISSLQAEPMGYKTYERIGYRTVADFHVYTGSPSLKQA
ncbi:MAG TPA: GNAT family N-acetyltransferase, partial [Acidimicrobiia bacterium]